MVGSVSRVCWKLTTHGTDNIPSRDSGGLIIASNHQTYIDPFWISVAIRRPIRYLAWDVAFDWPVVGTALNLLGAWPLQVERSDPAAIRRALQWLRDGGAVVIFPEGGRSGPDGAMLHFKAGAVRLALEADVPILPVTIRGAHRVWPRGWTIPRLAKVDVIYHPVHKAVQLAGEETRRCARRESQSLAAIIASAL
jgi:1-acyl-sn-glycerol-3-phosphate acyltransferase